RLARGSWLLNPNLDIGEEDTKTATFRTIPGVSNDVVSSIPLQPIPRSSGPINGLGLFAFERTTSFPHRFSDLFMFNHQLYIAKFPEIIWEVCLLIKHRIGHCNHKVCLSCSRSHDIFTITVEQMRKINTDSPENGIYNGSLKEEYHCAKLHIVYLAGSERTKRTGSDGMKVKEACISTADINAEETLNTLKYAIRARNIRNKPVVNRDHVSSEMLKMRQQLEYLQAELPLRDGGSSCANSRYVVDLSEMIAYLETANELHQCRSRYAGVKHSEKKFKDIQYDEIIGLVKPDGLKRSLHSMESSNYAMVEAT
ncbi:hypothetical protein HID58_069240, partial [Brassica napus]